MSGKQKKNDEELIQNITEQFDNLNPNELKEDIEKSRKLKESKDSNIELTNFAKSFISKYSNSKLTMEVFKKMNYEIVSKLINLRADFLPLMNIYMMTTDKINSKILKRHFILKDKDLKKIEDGDTEKAELPFIKFGINLSCTYSKISYYHTFIKGILCYFKLAFKKDYLKEYIDDEYYDNIDIPKHYTDNDSTICDKFNKMLTNMYRIVKEESDKEVNESQEIIKPKIKKITYQTLRVKARLYRNPEFESIYDDSKNNEEIFLKINTLLNDDKIKSDDDLYAKIVSFKVEIENQIKSEETNMYIKESKSKKNTELFSLQKSNNNLREENKKLNDKIDNLEEKCNTIITENNELKTQVENLTKQNNEIIKQNNEIIKQNNELNTRVKQLERKVEFMEPIVLSLIFRKVLNYSIIKILEKYSAKIVVSQKRLQNNEIQYKITFIDSVNGIDKDVLNKLIDKIFSRKDEYNSDSHLINKDVPSFLPNLWDELKKSLKLSEAEITTFDAIITTDIMSGFNFGADDLSVKSYLKKIEINKSGK